MKPALVLAAAGGLLALYYSRAQASAMPSSQYSSEYQWEYDTPADWDTLPTNGGDNTTKFFNDPIGETMQAFSKLTRGERNNNPGNIVRNSIVWQGMDPDQSGDRRFVVFQTPEYGIRALGTVLRNYSKHAGTPGIGNEKIDTVQEIISRWAPTFENNTAAYVQSVANKLGVTPTEPINVYDPRTLRALVDAIIQHENGRNIYAGSGVVDAGLSMMA